MEKVAAGLIYVTPKKYEEIKAQGVCMDQFVCPPVESSESRLFGIAKPTKADAIEMIIEMLEPELISLDAYRKALALIGKKYGFLKEKSMTISAAVKKIQVNALDQDGLELTKTQIKSAIKWMALICHQDEKAAKSFKTYGKSTATKQDKRNSQ